jgi:hypothetical protein
MLVRKMFMATMPGDGVQRILETQLAVRFLITC